MAFKTARGETYHLELYKRLENSAYEWNPVPLLTFKGRPANTMEIKNYRIQQGTHGNTDSIYVLASNLPADVKPNDKVVFLGKEWQVMSTGYYFDNSRVVNAGIFSDEYLIKNCPKGLNLQ